MKRAAAASRPLRQPTSLEPAMPFPALIIGRRRSWVVALFFLLLAGVLVGVLPEAERNASSTDSLPKGYDSTRVVELSERFPEAADGTALILWTSTDGSALTEEQIAAARTSLFERLPEAAEAGPAGPPPGVGGPDAAGPPPGVGGSDAAGPPAGVPPLPLVSEDGTAAFGTITVDTADGSENRDAVEELRTQLREEAAGGVTVQVTGPAGIRADLGAVFEGANFRLLAATAAVVALLLLVTYRSPVLWLIPLLVVGLADRLATILATHTLRLTGVPWDESTVGILSVLVFGAGTNYALLLISRYRDELRASADRFVAMRRALRYAGEAIVTSASTVVLGVLTLLFSVFPATRGLGLASAVGIVVAAGYALVVLPSVLVLFGRWVFWPLIPRVGSAALVESRRSVWGRVGGQVARRPAVFVACSASRRGWGRPTSSCASRRRSPPSTGSASRSRPGSPIRRWSSPRTTGPAWWTSPRRCPAWRRPPSARRSTNSPRCASYSSPTPAVTRPAR